VRKLAITLFAAALVVAACSTSESDDDADATTPDTATEETTAETTADTAEPVDTTAEDTADTADTTEPASTEVPATTEAPAASFPPVVDDRAPGVTDTSVKVGVVYLDLSQAGPILGINQGDYVAAFQAAFDTVNEAGGVNGRLLEPVYTPIVPASADQGTAACTKLTEDESVFVVLGNYIDENAPCIVTTHETPLLGGDLAMNAETLAAAKALWYAIGGGAAQQDAGMQSLVDQGLLDGNVGVVGALGFESLYEQGSKLVLDAGGVNVVDVAYLDVISGAGDPNALFAAAETISLKFESEGIDQITFNTNAGQVFPNGLARTDYRPQLLFDRVADAQLYANGDGSDLSVMENAIGIGPYDAQNLFPEMGGVTAECIASQEEKLGITILPTIEVPDGDPDYWASSSVACNHVALLVAMLEAAGPELNWGTFTSAGWNLGEVELVTAPDPYYFDKDHPNGSPILYTYEWDAAAEVMAVTEDAG
jgi:hypothetical protein